MGEARVMSREITELGWFAPKEMPGEMALDQQFVVSKTIGEEELR